MAKAIKEDKEKIYDLTINVTRASIFSSYNFPNYVDEHNTPRDLKDARGNVMNVGLTVGMIVTRFNGNRSGDEKVINWLLDHPLVKSGNKVSFVNITEKRDESVDREIEAAELTNKVLSLDTAGMRGVSAIMNYSYNSEEKLLKASLIRASKRWSDDTNSAFQKLRKALENKDATLHLDIKQFMEYGIIKFETGVFSFIMQDGSSSPMGISTEACVLYLKEHNDIYAVMKQILRENKKASK